MKPNQTGIATEAQGAECPDTALVRDARGRIIDADGAVIESPPEPEEEGDDE